MTPTPEDVSAHTVHLLVSPDAGRGKAADALEDIRATLADEGVAVFDITADSASDSAEAAHRAVADGADRIITVGGDGLVHLALQAVAGTGTVLGVIPVGTGNDFAGALGLPTDPTEATRGALGPVSPTDALQVGDHWVASVATAGFSGDVNDRANRMRYPRGPSRYTIATLLELPRLRNRSVRLTVDGIAHEYDAAMLALANTRDFGGGMQICPAADATDGFVDVTVVADIGRIELLRFFRLVFDGRHLGHPKVHTHRGAEITIECDELVLWGDGEPLGAAPVSCRAVSGAIQLARRAQ